MGHEVYQLQNGNHSVAHVNEMPWHGLSNVMTQDATPEEWKETVFNYTLETGKVLFPTPDGMYGAMDNREVVYRSDTYEPLEVVSTIYNIVQPAEAVDVFASLVKAGKMTIETAGSLLNGKKYWCLCRLGKDIDLGHNDKLQMYALIATSCDKSLATTVMITSVRVVCNNTLTAAIWDAEKGLAKKYIKIPHSKKLNYDKILSELGLFDDSIEKAKESYSKMIDTKLKKKQAAKMLLNLFKPATKGKVELEDIKINKFKQIWENYNSPDSKTTKDSLWGAVNAVTAAVDHNPNSKTTDTKLDSAWFGEGANLKRKVVEHAEKYAIYPSLVDEILLEPEVASIIDSIVDETTKTTKPIKKDRVDSILDMVSV